MPVILVNNANSIEVDLSAALKYTVQKGQFDVILESTGQDAGMVFIVLRSNAITEKFIRLDWREISSPSIDSAEALRDLLIGWNVQKVELVDHRGNTLHITPDGAMQIQDRFLAIAKGTVEGHSLMLKFGRNPDIDSGVEETVWEGGDRYPFPTTAQSLEVISGSTDDTALGSGARTITLIGLDADYQEQTEVIILNGTTPVAIDGTWLRVHRCSVTTAGSGNVNAGLISVRIAGGGTTLLVIGAGNGQTLMAVYTVPAGITAYMLSYYVSANATPTPPYADAKLFTRPAAGVINLKHQQALGPGYFMHKFEIPFKIEEKTDIYVNAVTNQNNCDICAGFDLILITN